MYEAMNNDRGCGSQPLNEDECKLAAKQLGYNEKVSVGRYVTSYGCFVGHVDDGWKFTYFNLDKDGKIGNPRYKSLCRKGMKLYISKYICSKMF